MYRISQSDTRANRKVNAIKGLRLLTGLGLREAKTKIEEFYFTENGYTQTVTDHVDIKIRADRDEVLINDGIAYLREAGCKVVQLNAFENNVMAAAQIALEEEDVDTAVALLQIIQSRKNR